MYLPNEWARTPSSLALYKCLKAIVPPHPHDIHDIIVREVCSALLEHDLATLHLLIAPHVRCHVPGRNRYAGEHQGFDEVFALWLEVTQRRVDTLELQVEDVLTSAHLAAALCRCTCERKPISLVQRVICLLHIDGGRIVECWLYPEDQVQVDAFWS